MSGQMQKKTSGWLKEKEAMQEKIKKMAIANYEKEQAKNWKPSLKELGTMHQMATTLYKAGLTKMYKDCINKETGDVIKMPEFFDLDRVWRVIKTEKGEPINVTKSENNHT